MRTVLEKYQERLINLSSRNMSLVLNRIAKKRGFDMMQVETYYEALIPKLIDFVKSGKESAVLLNNPQKWYTDYRKALNKELKAMESLTDTTYYLYYDQLKNKSAYKDILKDLAYETTEGKAVLLQVIREYKEGQLNAGYEQLMSMSKGLDYLRREIQLEKNETGISNLYISYKFIEGRFDDGSICRAPMCLLPVEIIKENNRWLIINKDKAEIELNKVFVISAIKNNQIKKEKPVFELGETDITKQVLGYYKACGIDVEIDDDALLPVKMPTYRAKESYEDYKNGQLTLKHHIVIGRFPTSNAIYEDYEQLLRQNLVTPEVEHLLNPKYQADNMDGVLSDHSTDLSEKDHFFISTLDHSQEMAIKDISANPNLVLFGPPGTGKSQTIVNMVADSLAKGKRVLMVSQKRAALDVIYNRLGDINSKMMLIHDAGSGKKEFYGKIKNLCADYEEAFGQRFHYVRDLEVVQTEHQEVLDHIIAHAVQIEETLDRFKALPEALHRDRERDQSLYELCHKAWSTGNLSEEQEILLNQYLGMKSEIPVFTDDYVSQEAFIEQVFKEGYHIKLHRYYHLNKTYSLLQDIDENPDFSVLHNIDQVVDQIVEKLNHVKGQLSDEDYSHAYKAFCDQETIAKEKKAVDDYVRAKYGKLLEPIAHGGSRVIKMIFSRKKLMAEEAKNEASYQAILASNQAHLESLKQCFGEIDLLIDQLKPLITADRIEGLKRSSMNNLSFLEASQFTAIREHFNEYMALVDDLDKLNSNEQDFITYVINTFDKQSHQESFLKTLSEVMFYDAIQNRLLYQQDVRSILETVRHYDTLSEGIKTDMAGKIKLTKEYIHASWEQQFIIAAKKSTEYSEFRRLANLKRRFRPIRQYFENFDDILMNMFPCFLMGPETVSEVLPLVSGLFDVIIFDEASQMFVEEAIPSIYRAKKAVIAGDDKQLKPSGLFRKRLEDEVTDDQYNTATAAAMEEESLLDLAKVTYPQSYLDFHYRSRFSELINFSNYAFYNGRLKLAPNTKKAGNDKPILRYLVQGALWEDRRNALEARYVVKTLSKLLKSRIGDETVGIITFNTGQQDEIYDQIEAERSKDPKFDELVQSEFNRFEGDENVSLFVKNIENVQGDERDIIIFSTGYATNEKGKMVQQFGSLSQAGGENRLNVAISRAKEKVILITSFEPEVLNVENAKQRGPKLFKQYLEYARAISAGSLTTEESILSSMVESPVVLEAVTGEMDGSFEQQISDAFEEDPYEFHSQVGVSGYKIDLAVYDPKLEQYVLGIECDGSTYCQIKSTRERDIHRKKFLESRDWSIYRMWSTDWWMDREGEIDGLRNAIEEAIVRARKLAASEADYNMAQVLFSPESVETEPEVVDIEGKITFGDQVLLKDQAGELFTVGLEKNKHNRQFMTELEMLLLGMEVGSQVSYNEFTYTIEDLIREAKVIE